jgi:hypothetical protein
MREADATAYVLENARVDRGRNRLLPVLNGGGHDRTLRLPARRNDKQRRARLVWQRGQPNPHELS